MKDPEYYDKLAEIIITNIQTILPKGVHISYTGTVDPRFYEGHKEYGETGGLKLYIYEKKYKPYPTLKQIEDYWKRIAETVGS